jgi:hypothetical protein
MLNDGADGSPLAMQSNLGIDRGLLVKMFIMQNVIMINR